MTLESDEPIELVGGWVRETSQCMYQNPWIQVFHEQVKRPDGSPGIYGRVHFRGTAVGVVPLDEEGNTWLVKQSRYTLNQYTWEIPEGGAQKGEDPQLCAARELEEEVGLKAQSFREILRLHTSNSVTDEAAVVYVAEGLSPGTQQLEASEDIEVKKLSLQEAVQMVLRGEITDAISVAALLSLAVNSQAGTSIRS